MINGAKLKYLREKERWSLRKLGKQIGVSGAHIGQIENNKSTSNTIVLKKLCKFFNVSADYLLDLKESKEIETK